MNDPMKWTDWAGNDIYAEAFGNEKDKWTGQLRSQGSHGSEPFWTCGHKHSTSHIALACSMAFLDEIKTNPLEHERSRLKEIARAHLGDVADDTYDWLVALAMDSEFRTLFNRCVEETANEYLAEINRQEGGQ
jgi:hypothetical protein